MILVSTFIILAAFLLFVVLFIDEETFINLTVAIGVMAYFLIAMALVILIK